MNGNKGYINEDYVQNIGTTPISDVASDNYEQEFVKDKTCIKVERVAFYDEDFAMAYATSEATESKMWKKYGTTMYFYISKASPNGYVVHWYQ
ncbi:MAG: hypothetical protein HUJ53_03515 [Holdemanella sp.]|nr:hypothetical protein [Holdemanella sp.]